MVGATAGSMGSQPSGASMAPPPAMPRGGRVSVAGDPQPTPRAPPSADPCSGVAKEGCRNEKGHPVGCPFDAHA